VRKDKKRKSRSRSRERSRERTREKEKKRYSPSPSKSKSRSPSPYYEKRSKFKPLKLTLNLLERVTRWSSKPPSEERDSGTIPFTNTYPSNYPNIYPNNQISMESNQLYTISDKLKQINPLLGLSSQNHTTSILSNPNSVAYSLTDNSKIKRKIYIPKESGVNFVGLLIGPKGTYQKRLEQQSGCKILIRGK